jgi:hypothetical protein
MTSDALVAICDRPAGIRFALWIKWLILPGTNLKSPSLKSVTVSASSLLLLLLCHKYVYSVYRSIQTGEAILLSSIMDITSISDFVIINLRASHSNIKSQSQYG